MTTAFVLSGGGSLGAVQVGMLQALTARGVEPDLLVGTSAGAINAAYVAGHGAGASSLDGLAALWARLRRRDVFPFQPARLGAAVLGWAPSLCANAPLRRLIGDHLTFDRLEESMIPLYVVATDVASGQEVLLSDGNAVDAVLASSAIPAVFPSIRIAGRDLIDGGVADNAAVSQAVTLGADIVYVLPSGHACALQQAPVTPVASALRALTLLIEQRLILEVAHFAEHDLVLTTVPGERVMREDYSIADPWQLHDSHHKLQERFSQMFPDLDLRINVSFVDTGKVITSQGGARSYEAAMHLVDRLYGRQVAEGVGKGLLVPWPPDPDTMTARIIEPVRAPGPG